MMCSAVRLRCAHRRFALLACLAPLCDARPQLVHNLAYSHDGWVFDPSAIATLEAQKGLLDLTDLVRSSSSVLGDALDWGDVLPHLRDTGMLYQGRTVMLPLDANMMLLYYRKVWTCMHACMRDRCHASLVPLVSRLQPPQRAPAWSP